MSDPPFFSGCATVEQIRTRWHELAQTHHPDHGGDPATFIAAQRAYRAALATAEVVLDATERRDRCPTCDDGRAPVTVRTGWVTVRLAACPTCGRVLS